MNEPAAIEWLRSLPRERKVKLCACLCRELTIIGRTAYDLPELSAECARLRAVNEIQHHMMAILDELLEGERGYHDKAIASVFLGERPDKYLQQLLTHVFERAVPAFCES